MSGRAWAVLTATAAVVTTFALSPVPAEGAGGTGPGDPPRPRVIGPGHGDRDGDRIDDLFAGTLRRAAAGHRFDVIVTGIDVAAAERLVGRVTLRRELSLIDGFSATMTAGQARALARRPGVRRIEQVATVRVVDDGSNRDFGASAVPVDHPGVDGSGVGLCVVDTGVDPAHEQIAPRTVAFFDAVNGRTTAYDDHGHGTHVTSIAAGDGVGGSSAATFVGVAPAATLYAAKVLDASGSGTNDQVVAGIDWCATQPGVSVISMSLGDTAGGDGTDATSLAVDRAVTLGKVVVVAAGNSGDSPRTINAPGTARGAITVGAVSDHSSPVGTARHDDGIWLAAFSSRGPTSDGRTKPDLVAPGLTITAAQRGTVSGDVSFSGTSMATPYVAGAAVLVRETAPAATPADVRAALAGQALDVGAAGVDNEYGAGLVDVRAAVDAVSGTSPVRRTAFPQLTRVVATVPNAGSVDIPIDVPAEGVGVPLAVTLTISGQPVCYYGCLVVEWSPDLDMELRSPSGTVLATSECTLSGLSCGIGRQETVGIRPPAAGTYVLHVFAWNGGNGAPVTADISRGPVGSTAPPPPPANVAPVADAGPDQTVRANRKTKLGSFTLDGSRSSDPDGTIVGYRWSEGTTVVGTTAKLSLKRAPGTYLFTLVVTDDDGATGSDTVTIVVR
jgi:serine protease AprX